MSHHRVGCKCCGCRFYTPCQYCVSTPRSYTVTLDNVNLCDICLSPSVAMGSIRCRGGTLSGTWDLCMVDECTWMYEMHNQSIVDATGYTSTSSCTGVEQDLVFYIRLLHVLSPFDGVKYTAIIAGLRPDVSPSHWDYSGSEPAIFSSSRHPFQDPQYYELDCNGGVHDSIWTPSDSQCGVQFRIGYGGTAIYTANF